MADINSQVAEALSRGVGPQDILDHLSSSSDPEHRAWVANYKTNLVADNQEPTSSATSANITLPSSPNVSGVQALGGVINKAAQNYADLPGWAQIALPVGITLGTYAGGKAINSTFNTLEDKRKANIEVEKQAALNALEPSAAVKVQQQQLALQQAEQANRFAQQAAGANAGPVEDPLLNARVQTETQRAATESARTEAAKHEAALAQERLIAAQRKAAMVKANPAGAAAQVAAAEGLPIEAQSAVAPKPTIADLQQKLGVTSAGPAAPATPAAPVPPTASVVPTPDTAIVNNTTGATPADKAVAIVNAPETPVPPPKTPRAERGSLATIANNPAPVEGMPGMRENYTKPKGINPATGEPFIGPGGYNWLANQVGPEAAPKMWEEQYGKRNVPHAQVQADYSATRYPPTAVTVEGQSGGAFGKQKFIPEYIKGAATPAALATTALAAALPALGVAAVNKYQGNKEEVNKNLQEAKDAIKSLATMPYEAGKEALHGNVNPLIDMITSLHPVGAMYNALSMNDQAIIEKMLAQEKWANNRKLGGISPPTR